MKNLLESEPVFFYWGKFTSSTNGVIGHHTREFGLNLPLEYGSDIKAVQDWLAKEIGADFVMLIQWQEIKGIERPKIEGGEI